MLFVVELFRNVFLITLKPHYPISSGKEKNDEKNLSHLNESINYIQTHND